jgi:hypothetical protein
VTPHSNFGNDLAKDRGTPRRLLGQMTEFIMGQQSLPFRYLGLGLIIFASAFWSNHARAHNAAPVTMNPTAVTQTDRQAQRCEGSQGYGASFGGRRTYIWRPQWMTQIKTATNRHAVDVRRDIITQARAALRREPYSVTDKPNTPASGNKHDYHSLGPYWWPDPTKPDGLPYKRRDGQANPERNGESFDVRRLSALSSDVSALARAYFITEDRAYAQQAAQLIRTWFLDPATRMNPNLSYAQAIPGVTAGRAEGIIDGHRFIPIIESIGLLAPSGALSPIETQGLQTWFGELLTWMLTSEIGQEERAKTNNHGIYYDLLASHYALFSGKEDVAREIITAFPSTRIARQFAPDGSLPKELTRTRSWHYVNWTLAATSKLAGLGECVGVDLWTYTSPEGAGLRRSMSWLAQYVAREATWNFPETAFAPGGDPKAAYKIAFENFRLAAWGLDDPAFDALATYYGKLHPTADEHGWLPPLTQTTLP